MPKPKGAGQLVQEFQISRDTVIESLRASAIKLVAPESLSLSEGTGEVAAPLPDGEPTVNRTALGSPSVALYGTRPGDIILLRTPGLVYKCVRELVDHNFDHAVVVVNDHQVVHVSPPKVRLISIDTVLQESRHPVVLRPRNTDIELFLSKLTQLVGAPYAVGRLWSLVVRRAASRLLGMNALPQLAFRYQTKNSPWICTDAILEGLLSSSAALQQSAIKIKPPLDATRFGVASLEDLINLSKFCPSLLAQVPTCRRGVDESITTTRNSPTGEEVVWIAPETADVSKRTPGSDGVVNSLLGTTGSGSALMEWLLRLRDYLLSANDWKTLEHLAEIVITQFQMFTLRHNLAEPMEQAWGQVTSNTTLRSARMKQLLFAFSLLIVLRQRHTLVRLVVRIIQTLLIRRLLLDSTSFIRSVDPVTLKRSNL